MPSNINLIGNNYMNTSPVCPHFANYFSYIENQLDKGQIIAARVTALAHAIFQTEAAIQLGMHAVKLGAGIIAKVITYPLRSIVTNPNPLLELPDLKDFIVTAMQATFCFLTIIPYSIVAVFDPKSIKDAFTKVRIIGDQAIQSNPLPNNVISKKAYYGFASIVRMEKLKEQMQKIINVFVNKDLAAEFNASIPSGILLSGKPGGGKTFFANRFKEELEIQLGRKVSFFELKHSETSSKYLHETSQKVHQVFLKAELEAKTNNSLSIVFIDEIDTVIPPVISDGSLGSQAHNEERGTYLKELDAARNRNIIVIGTTNHPQKISSAIKRPGRLDIHFEIPLPDADFRFDFILTSIPHNLNALTAIEITQLANSCDGWSVSDLKLLIENSLNEAFSQTLNKRRLDPEAEATKLTVGLVTEANKTHPKLQHLNQHL